MTTASTKKKRELLSPRAFGKKKGVSRQAVMQAIQSGRITERAASKDDVGNWRINVAAAEREWEANSDPAQRREAKGNGRPVAVVEKTPDLFEPERRGRELKEHAQRLNHAQASTERTLVDAELKRLELEERRGKLVSRAAVTREAYRSARAVRDRLLSIPDAIAHQLAAMDRPEAVHERLNRELVAALEELARSAEVAVR